MIHRLYATSCAAKRTTSSFTSSSGLQIKATDLLGGAAVERGGGGGLRKGRGGNGSFIHQRLAQCYFACMAMALFNAALQLKAPLYNSVQVHVSNLLSNMNCGALGSVHCSGFVIDGSSGFPQIACTGTLSSDFSALDLHVLKWTFIGTMKEKAVSIPRHPRHASLPVHAECWSLGQTRACKGRWWT